MSRRKKQSRPNSPPPNPPRRIRNTGAEYPKLTVTIDLRRDHTVLVDPVFNDAAIEHLDVLYEAAQRDDYDSAWSDDHKIAFYIWNLMEDYLQQWDSPVSQDEVDIPVSEVPHIKQSPVVDQFDLSGMERAKK